MLNKFSKLIAFLAIILMAGFYAVGSTSAANTDSDPDEDLIEAHVAVSNITTITVLDKLNKPVPFATVNVTGLPSAHTGPKGEPINLTLSPKKYSVTATHPYLKDKKGKILTGKGSLKLSTKKPGGNFSIKLAASLPTDPTPPEIDRAAPNSPQAPGQDTLLSFSTFDKETNIAAVDAVLDGTDLGKPAASGSNYTWPGQQLPIGQHMVTYVSWNYIGKMTTKEVSFSITDPATTGLLTGQVTSDGTPVNNAQIVSDDGRSTASDAQGNYSFASIGNGNRTITVTASGYISQSQTVAIATGQTSNLNINLVAGQATIPSVPTNLQAVNQAPTSTQQAVSWSAVGGAGITYEIQRLLNGSVAETKTTSGTSTNFTGLTPNTPYSYQVRAKNNAGPSAWSSVSSATTRQSPTLNWVSPADNATVKGTVNLQVSYASFGGTSNSIQNMTWSLLPSTSLGTNAPNNTGGTVTQSWDTTKTTNGTITLRVSVTDTEGNTTSADRAFAINNITTVQTGTVTGTVSFNTKAVASATVKSDDGKTTTTDATGKYTLSGVSAGTRQITATSSNLGDTTASATVTANQSTTLAITMTDKVAPSVPANLAIDNVDPNTQDVNWTAANDFSGIKDYIVQRLDASSTVQETKTVTAINYTFENLTGGTTYYYRVQAEDKAVPSNLSAWSPIISKTTDNDQQAVPTITWFAPANSSNVSGTVSLTVSYTAPAGGKNVKMVINETGTVLGDTATTDTSGQIAGSWNSTTVANGTYHITATVTDKNNATANAVLTLTVNNAPQKGTLTGQVTGLNSSAVNDATLTLKNGSTVIATINNDPSTGAYTFTDIPAGTYTVSVTGEGYQDKTISNVTVSSGQTTTTPIQMTALPLIGLDAYHELAAPAAGWKNTTGLSIRPGTNQMIIGNKSTRIDYYNAKTETFIRSLGVPDTEILGFDNQGYFAGGFGNSSWVGDDDTQTTAFHYHWVSASPMNDGTVWAATDNHLFHFVNRISVPNTLGWSTSSLFSALESMTTGNKSLFISSGTDNKLYKLSQTDPINGPKTSLSKSYNMGNIYAVPGTRTIIAREYVSTNTELKHTVHLIDSLTFQDYGSIELPGDFAPTWNTAAFVDADGSIKIFMTCPGDKVFVINTHQL